MRLVSYNKKECISEYLSQLSLTSSDFLIQLYQTILDNYIVFKKQAQLSLCKLGPGTVLIFYKSIAPLQY